MEAALLNPVILSEIFSYPCLEGLVLRQVCNTWNEVSLSLPKPKLDLKLGRVGRTHSEEKDFIDFCTHLEPRLARSVRLSKPKNDLEPDNWLHFTQLYSDQLQYLSVSIGKNQLPVLHEILRDFTPQLRQLNFILSEKNVTRSTPIYKLESPLPAKPLLKVISFEIDPRLTTMYQDILDSAPNLEKLKIESNLFPDLSRNTRLHTLACLYGFDNILEEECSRMLGQVAKSVEHLILLSNVETTFVQLPILMPKLKYFRNDAINIFKCGNGDGGLGWLQDSPNLDTLCISQEWYVADEPTFMNDFIRNLLENGPLTFPSVTKLYLRKVEDALESISQVKTVFPSLKELHVSFNLANCTPDEFFAKMLPCFERIEVDKLTISFVTNLELSVLIKSLWEWPNAFKGIKKLNILMEEEYHIMDDSTSINRMTMLYGLEATLLNWREKDVTFSGVLLGMENACHISDFIKEKGLNVKFINDEFSSRTILLWD